MVKTITNIIQVEAGSVKRLGKLVSFDFIYNPSVGVINIQKDNKLYRCLVRHIEPDFVEVREGDIEITRDVVVEVERITE